MHGGACTAPCWRGSLLDWAEHINRTVYGFDAHHKAKERDIARREKGYARYCKYIDCRFMKHLDRSTFLGVMMKKKALGLTGESAEGPPRATHDPHPPQHSTALK